jgi:hypothetical protein
MKFTRRCRDASKNEQAKQRSKINISDAKFGGDPHPNSNASNWLLLDRYVGIGQRSGIYGSKFGDTLDSWRAAVSSCSFTRMSDTPNYMK